MALFADVLFKDRNFIYRDAGHFYYPYFRMIAQQWGEGKVPLWNPFENGGEPLAGNPTASVFYPLKVLFALPYAVAFKWYHLGHVLLAFAACFVAARATGRSVLASAAAGLAYAFSGTVLFQIYNIVFLVGAAWLPLGLLCVDRTVRTPRLSWALGLSAVLALQVLGGDPEIAFVTGLFAVPYALYFHYGAWTGTKLLLASLGIGYGLVQFRLWGPDLLLAVGERNGLQAAWKIVYERAGYAASIVCLAGAGITIWGRNFRRVREAEAGFRCGKLLFFAGAVSFVLAAVQVLPTLDLVRVADRSASEAPHESVAFSFFPARLPELVFPAFFGRQFPINTRWAPFEAMETGIWIPSLYMGLAPILLALAGLRFRKGPVQIRALSWLLVLMFWLAIGKFGGPMWLMDKDLGKAVDPVRVEDRSGFKMYGHSDGLYRVLEETVPGFRSFRYPAKMLVFCALAVSLLAAFGWDSLFAGELPRFSRLVIAAAVISAAFLLIAFMLRTPIIGWFEGMPRRSSGFGPFLPTEAWRDLVAALAHCFVVAAAIAVVLRLRRVPSLFAAAPALLLLVTACDLYLADRWLMLTDEQSAIDAKPKIVEAIEADRLADGDPSPYRVHRTRIYEPFKWRGKADPERDVVMSRWERMTIQPKYGLPFGVQYATTTGTMAIYDVEFFFAPWTVPTPPQLARQNLPDILVYFPRRGFDLWNTRYFVLPKGHVFDHDERGVITMLRTREGRPLPVLAESPADQDDYLVLKNTEAFPRAWIVHQAEFIEPVRTLRRRERTVPMERLLYRELDAGIPLWTGRQWGEYPLRSRAMLEHVGTEDLSPYLSGAVTTPSESVRIDLYEADRAVMTATLETPGLLILADTFHQGWTATVDGEPAPIIRANRAMRAVPVPSGEHVVEMRYHSRSFVIGAALSAAGWVAVTGFFLVCAWRRNGRQAEPIAGTTAR